MPSRLSTSSPKRPIQHQQHRNTRLRPGVRRQPVSLLASPASRIPRLATAQEQVLCPRRYRKKSSFTASVSGKENRQPQLVRTRVRAPPVTPPVAVAVVPSVPPRSIRRAVAVVAQPSRAPSRESTPPRPLVVKKRTSLVHAAGSLQGDSRIRSAAAAAGAPLGFPAAIKALVEDIDCFAKG